MSPQDSAPLKPERDTPWKLIVFAVLAVYALLIIFLNREQVDVSFVFFSAEISLVVALLITAGIGFAAGYYLREIRGRRRARRSSS